MIVRTVCIAFILLISSHYCNILTHGFRSTSLTYKIPIQIRLLSAVKDSEPVPPKKFTLKSKKRVAPTSIVQYDDRVLNNLPTFIYQFNSTTVQAVLNVADKVSSWFASVESSFESLRITIATKVERDIRVTLGATDFVTRKATKTAQSITKTLTEVNTPLTLFLLPSNQRQESTRMLTSLKATNTKTRAEQVKKRVKKSIPILAADSALKAVKSLPKQLEYDYQRRVTRRAAEEAGSAGQYSRPDRTLPSSIKPREEEMVAALVPAALPPAASTTAVVDSSNEIIISSSSVSTTREAPSAYFEDQDEKAQQSLPISTPLDSSIIDVAPAAAVEVSKGLSLTLTDEDLLSWQAFSNILTNDQALEKLLFLFSESDSGLFDKIEELAASLRIVQSVTVQVEESLLKETLTFLQEKENKSEMDMQLVLLFRSLMKSADAANQLANDAAGEEMSVVCFDPVAQTLSAASSSSSVISSAAVGTDNKIQGSNSYFGISEPSAYDISAEYDDDDALQSSSSVNQAASATAVIIDTEGTVERSISKSELLIANVLLVIDVTFFLIEALIKATVPILTDGGKLAWERIQDTFPVPVALQQLRKGKDVWQLYSQFRYVASTEKSKQR